jgi:8-oxo-dGTP pyrophosphatase MutT (NUDIX family)
LKLNFDWKDDGKYHQYCAHCHAETVERVYEEGKTYYFCGTCQKRHERSIVIDPAVKWWMDDNGEYWHESTGVFVRNPSGKFLFFERNIFPFALTVPSGHVDANEEPIQSSSREIQEEVGIKADKLIKIATDDIVGDSCRRGADAHRWHSYLLPINEDIDVDVKEEGGSPVWLTLEEAMQKELIFPVRYVIDKSSNELITREI